MCNVQELLGTANFTFTDTIAVAITITNTNTNSNTSRSNNNTIVSAIWHGSEVRSGGFYFVCDHGKHRNAKRYIFGVTFLLGGRNKSYTQNRTV